ncbi:unnamed protein product [Symbiodinium sp. CCMP2592]|nr:unnamed protein product [Symbiodinium sp. CCMP2592]
MLVASTAAASVYNESIDGDLSGDRFNPTMISVDNGLNTVTMQVVDSALPGGDRDYFTFSIGAGQSIDSIVVTDAFNPAGGFDSTAFVGLAFDNIFDFDPDTFVGPGLEGFVLTDMSVVGTESIGALTGGLTSLGAGDYSFWVQQTGEDITELSLAINVVPSPSAMGVLALGGLASMASVFLSMERIMLSKRVVLTGMVLGALVVGSAMTGCASTGIAVRETLGTPKREQLVDRVDETRDAQENAKEQFATTLDELKSLTNFDGGELEDAYSRLKKQYERAESRADKVSSKIKSVERVGDALFEEWEEELEEYSTESLRSASEQQLDETRRAFNSVLRAMKTAESKMGPVLAAFGDQVLFLKHNLNARAIASLDDTLVELEEEIAQLIADMEASIDEANSFIDEMGS